MPPRVSLAPNPATATAAYVKTRMADYVATLTPETACELLRGAGVICSPGEVQIFARDERWAVQLPGDRIAWFPASEPGNRRLATERRVLSLIAARCSFQIPRVVFMSDLGFEVRQMVPGRYDPWALFYRCKADWKLARRIGRAIGAILAEQHAKIREADVAGWLAHRVAWPESGDWISERLPVVADDDAFIHAMRKVIAQYEAVQVGTNERVLIHGDIGLHNLALDPQTDIVNGIFDYDSAAWADRHHDFRYLLFDIGREDMFDAALEVYEPAVGECINRDRVRLYNAACAISYLAFRAGHPAEAKPCGRTLAEDIRWVRTALSKVKI